MKTAILDLAQHVTILEFNFEYTHALVMDEDGGEFEVSLDRLDGIEDSELDLSPIEKNYKK
jgi:hypothetical protein